jgi:hypothetical protein
VLREHVDDCNLLESRLRAYRVVFASVSVYGP